MTRTRAIIVTWNNQKDIMRCLDALTSTQGGAPAITLVDNHSTDGTVEIVRSHFPNIHIIELERNRGFAYANNVAMRESREPYVLLCNPDAFVHPGCLPALSKTLDEHPQVAAVGPKVFRFDAREPDLSTPRVLDTTGIVMKKSRAAFDRGAGEIDTGQYDQAMDVFGISGACVLLRRSALQEIVVSKMVLDEIFFSYKEDVDLAWRLQAAGWDARYVPEALSWHRRGARLGARAERGRLERQLSYRNHILLLLLNEYKLNLFWYAPEILWYELRKAMYLIFREPYTLTALPAILFLLSTVSSGRKSRFRMRKRSRKQLLHWFA